MAEQGLSIPRGLIIQYGPKTGWSTDRQPWITITHSPEHAEMSSVHDTYLCFRGEDDVPRVIDLAEQHALAMIRRNARAEAISKGGYDIRKPPFHMLEAAPLSALAFELCKIGKTGLDGNVLTQNGLLEVRQMTLTTPDGKIEFSDSRCIVRKTKKVWPETVLTSLVGRTLGHAVSLPRCGRSDIDDAIDSLIIHSVEHVQGTGIQIRVKKAPVLPLDEKDLGDDRRWMVLTPIPIA